MKRIATIAILLIILVGCKEQIDYREVPFIEMNQTKMVSQEHTELCERKPESIFCVNSPSIGDMQPTRAYAMKILLKMNSNFKYTNNDKWIYNETVHEYLEGDCEDIASTMAKHMIDEGIDKKYLSLAYRLISEKTAHLFLAVETSDAGILHLDYSNSGYPIEERINFHMKMTDVGLHKWVKGNIK